MIEFPGKLMNVGSFRKILHFFFLFDDAHADMLSDFFWPACRAATRRYPSLGISMADSGMCLIGNAISVIFEWGRVTNDKVEVTGSEEKIL